MDLTKLAVDAVAAAINPAEVSADTAALDSARTLAALLEARQQVGAPLSLGLLAISKVANATMLAVNAREELIRAHGLLDRVAMDLGYGKDVPPQAVHSRQSGTHHIPA